MGALDNASKLIQDANFRAWMLAAGAYQARQVITEDPATADHAVRYLLAVEVIVEPQMVVDRLVTLVGTDPDIATQGSDTSTLSESTVLNKVSVIWTDLAKLIVPSQ